MGVVESSFGPVAAGTLLTGIAAGFRPRVVNWPTNEPNKRSVDFINKKVQISYKICQDIPEL